MPPEPIRISDAELAEVITEHGERIAKLVEFLQLLVADGIEAGRLAGMLVGMATGMYLDGGNTPTVVREQVLFIVDEVVRRHPNVA
ncbi:MAG TPA: hypothetical protein VFD36_29570 [Kofleriaceae bacterium]|nr:hypothetical protein [Kofleriaceae bacterium]